MKFNDGDQITIKMPHRESTNAEDGEVLTVKGNKAYRGKEEICEHPEDWILVKKESWAHMNDAKYGIQYIRGEDPVEFFKTKKEAQKRIEQLLDDSEVDKTSIYLFEVGDVWEVKRPISFDLVKV